LRGAEINVEIAARIKLRRDLGEAGFLRRDDGGSLRSDSRTYAEGWRGFFAAAKIEGGEGAGQDERRQAKQQMFDFHDERKILVARIPGQPISFPKKVKEKTTAAKFRDAYQILRRFL
jgi:hypothetical protein